MIEIIKNGDRQDIVLTRGDSAYLDIKIYDKNKNPIILGEEDIVKCTIRDPESPNHALFAAKFVYTEDAITWHIYPEDTQGAQIKDYVYDMEVEFSNGDVFTFIPLSKFTLLSDSTRKDFK